MTEAIKDQIKAKQLEILTQKARSAKASAELAELHAAQSARTEAHFVVGDDFMRQHYFIGSVDSVNVQQAAQHLTMWHRLDPKCDMNIEIHSGGGSVLAGLYLFDQLTAYSKRGGGEHELTITVRGLAASMAGVLVQAADKRVIGPTSRLMIHELSAQTGGKLGEMEDAMAFYTQLNSDIADLYVDRSEGKCSREQFDKLWTRKDVWLTAKEAVSYGFIDEIG